MQCSSFIDHVVWVCVNLQNNNFNLNKKKNVVKIDASALLIEPVNDRSKNTKSIPLNVRCLSAFCLSECSALNSQINNTNRA